MKYANDNIIIPFKGRVINKKEPVRVYRNLNKKGVWYSIVQQGKTVAHTSAICLKDCKFAVNHKTRDRIRKTKRKEFHAYIEGTVTGSGMGTTAKRNDLPAVVKYNPYQYDNFVCTNLNRNPFAIKEARFVICNDQGVRAAYLNKL